MSSAQTRSVFTQHQKKRLSRNIVKKKAALPKPKSRFQKIAKTKVIGQITRKETQKMREFAARKREIAAQARAKLKQKRDIKRIERRLDEQLRLQKQIPKPTFVLPQTGMSTRQVAVLKARQVRAQNILKKRQIHQQKQLNIGIARARRDLKRPMKSSNVSRVGYDKTTLVMVIEFHPNKKGEIKPLYAYFNVLPTLYELVYNGMASCRTSGSNAYGEWYIFKNPSLGAAVWNHLREMGIEYKKLR